MRKRFLLSIFAAAVVLLSAVIAASDWRNGLGGDDRFRYDPSAEQVYEGTVGSKGHVMAGLMYFMLRVLDRNVEVQIGPADFVERSGFTFKIGETVTVVGMPVPWNGRDIVLARRVSSATSVLTVRDRDGYRMWDTKRPVKMDPELSNLHLCEMIDRSLGR